MIRRYLFPVAFAVGAIGLVLLSVPLVIGAMVVAVLAGFATEGE